MNKKQVFIMIVAILVALAVGGFLGYYINNKKVKDVNVDATPKKEEVVSGKLEITHNKKYDLSKSFNCKNTDTENKCEVDIKGVEINYNFDTEGAEKFLLIIDNKIVYSWDYIDSDIFGKDGIKVFELNDNIVLWFDLSPEDGYENITIFNKKGETLYNSNNTDYMLESYEQVGNSLVLSFKLTKVASNGVYTCEPNEASSNPTKTVKYTSTLSFSDGKVNESKSNIVSYQNFCKNS